MAMVEHVAADSSAERGGITRGQTNQRAEKLLARWQEARDGAQHVVSN